VNSNTRAAAQGQEPGNDGRFSVRDAVLIVDTEEEAHAARVHLGMEAFVYDRLAEQLPAGGLTGSVLVVSAHDAFARANSLIDGGAPRMGVMFVDLALLQGRPCVAWPRRRAGGNI
jgi:alkanesulfonate monooxygenase SsuD/methylene tetrahydromethanopterin reductase-like flavin-dependent oxidoreductase (luciferase family)